MIKSKKQMLLVIALFTLILIVGGVTYSFFNYTRTGAANTLKTGNISFNSTQDNTISLTNVFPTSSNSLNSTNSDTVTINITGDTTYTEGIEYKVTLDQVNNTINGKTIPISFTTTVTDLGDKETDYYTERGGEDAIYNVTETGVVEDGKYILVGYIPTGAEGVDGSIDITAFIDSSNVAISDTVSTIENGNFVYGETPGEWIAGRDVLTTDEWNSLSTNGISFKVKVEANEGIWVESPKQYVLKNLNGITDWRNIRTNITSIEFHKDGIAPVNSVASFDATDVTSEGDVTVYTVDDGLGNDTYKAVVVASDTIYAPVDCSSLFAAMSKLIFFNSENFKVDNVENMYAMFGMCSKLTNVDGLLKWQTSNVINMNSMFRQCTYLNDIKGLSNWNVSNVTNMQGMFRQCLNLANIDDLIKWNISSVQSIREMFYNCSNLRDVNGMINWNTSNVTDIQKIFMGCHALTDINGLTNLNVSNVVNMLGVFNGCNQLLNIDAIANWDVSNVIIMQALFGGCYSLNDIYPLTKWADKTGNVENMSYMFSLNDESKINDIIIDCSPLSNWNVSNVTNMLGMFSEVNISSYLPFTNWDVSKVQKFSFMFSATDASNVTSLIGLENWNVSSATNMESMFSNNISLTDASAINDWNINSNINFTSMFGNTPVHPEFIKFPNGTWDENGTFTPNA